MTWAPRLVALDIDGTIVDGSNSLSPAVREAVRAVRDAGIETVISTGRAIHGVLDTTGQLGFEAGHAVASNGAVVFDYDSAANEPVVIHHAVTFDPREAITEVLAQMPEAMIGVEELGVGWRVNRSFPDYEINGSIIVEPIEALVARPVTRVVVLSTEHSREEFHAIVERLGLADTNYFVGYSAWLDIAPQGVSKASGLEVLCHRLGLDRTDVLAVGDGMNDVDMLGWAGHGVAMGQAPDAVKAAADEICGSIDDDGLATLLRRYL